MADSPPDRDARAVSDPTDRAAPRPGPGFGPEPQIERSSLRQNVTRMTSAQVIGWVLVAVGAIIVPRYLGPATQGRLHLARSLWDVATIFAALGTTLFLQLAISRDQRRGLGLVTPVIAARSAAFACASVVLTGYVLFVEPNRTFAVLMVLVGLASLGRLVADVFSASFMGLERMTSVAAIWIFVRALGLVGTVTVILVDLGVFGIVGVELALAVTTLVLIVWRFLRISRVDRTDWWRRVPAVVRGGLPFMVVALALAAYRQIDVIVIAQVAGERDLGWYSAADLLFGSLLFPTTVIATSAFPTFGRLHADDRDGLRDLVRKTFSLLLVVSVPVGLGAAVVGPAFSTLVFGAEYDGVGPLLVIFGPVAVVTFGTTLLGTVALATERQRFLAGMLILSAALTIPLDVILVTWTADRFDNGAIGGALAFAATETLQLAVGLAVLAPYLLTRAMAWRATRLLAAGGLMVLAVWPVRELFVLVPATIGAIVYALSIAALRVLDDHQRSMLGDLAKKIGIPNRWAG